MCLITQSNASIYHIFLLLFIDRVKVVSNLEEKKYSNKNLEIKYTVLVNYDFLCLLIFFYINLF